MDEDVSRWILEFLLRQPMPPNTLHKILSILPLSDRDSRLKKTLLLRYIQSEIEDGSISETVLETIEVVQVLDRLDGVAVTASMRVAYCAVAVCCTLEHVGHMGGSYFSAVKRIWRGKVDQLEGKSGLFSDELAEWRDDIESAVLDENAQRNLVKKRDTREHALRSVKSYLEEAWAVMGPPFLEAATKVMMGVRGLSRGSEQADRVMGVTAAGEHDSTQNLEGNDGGRVELGAEMVNRDLGGNASERVEVAPQLVSQEEVHGLGEQLVADNVVQRVEVAPQLVTQEVHRLGDQMVADNVAQRVEVAPQLVNQEVDGLGDQMVADNVVQRVEVAPQLVNQAVDGLGDQLVADNVVQRVASLRDSSQDLGGGEGGRLELAAKAVSPEQVQGLGNKRVGETDGKKAAKSPRKKHVARRKRFVRRAEIVDAEDSGSDVSCTRNDCLPSPEVRQVQEALKTSNMELKAKVKDPLPDALNVSEAVRCELQRKHVNDRPSTEEQHRSGVAGEPIPDVERTDESNQVNQNTAARPSLLERNATAHTYGWNDSIDSDTSESTSKRTKKIHLPTPNRIDCSLLKNLRAAAKIGNRRKVKRWSTLEEDTLRMGVHRFGKGNWKAILSHYEDVFEERTDVDLKDKWRNMTK